MRMEPFDRDYEIIFNREDSIESNKFIETPRKIIPKKSIESAYAMPKKQPLKSRITSGKPKLSIRTLPTLSREDSSGSVLSNKKPAPPAVRRVPSAYSNKLSLPTKIRQSNSTPKLIQLKRIVSAKPKMDFDALPSTQSYSRENSNISTLSELKLSESFSLMNNSKLVSQNDISNKLSDSTLSIRSSKQATKTPRPSVASSLSNRVMKDAKKIEKGSLSERRMQARKPGPYNAGAKPIVEMPMKLNLSIDIMQLNFSKNEIEVNIFVLFDN